MSEKKVYMITPLPFNDNEESSLRACGLTDEDVKDYLMVNLSCVLSCTKYSHHVKMLEEKALEDPKLLRMCMYSCATSFMDKAVAAIAQDKEV